MGTINLLIVEDDSRQQKSYLDSINQFNKTTDTKITHVFKKNFDEAKEFLNQNSYDAAIIDIKLGGTDMKGQGNEIIKLIKGILRFPVYVVTGVPEDIEPELKEENIFFRICERDKIIHLDLFMEMKKMYDTGLTRILGGRGLVDNYLTKIFWNNLSTSFQSWYESPNPEKSLLRYTMTHLLEYLEIDDNGTYENYQSTEVYISPMIGTKLKTGCIVVSKHDGKNYIILTPSCDLAQDKTKYVIISEICPLTTGIVNEKINILKGNDDKLKEEANIVLDKLIRNRYSNKYYFLPKSEKYPGGIINFQKFFSIQKKDIDSDYSIALSISHQFVKDIIVKFSYYYSRQGSPDLDKAKVLADLLI